MNQSFLLATIFTFCTIISFGQTPIDVVENTIKISANSEENFYYGLAEGDQLVFSIEEINGKELKEFEITAMPSSSIFLDYKTKKIEQKTILIQETGIYKFRLMNSNLLSGRICKFRIQRIPASDATKKFNPIVYKRTVYDTSYYNVKEEHIVKSDTVATEILNQTAKVHSSTNPNGNKTTTSFLLPENTISWAYYIGVDQSGEQAYKKATQQLISNSSPILKSLVGTSPLTALALGFSSYLTQIQSGEDIDYYLIPSEYLNNFSTGQQFRLYKQGKVINDFSKMQPIKGNLSFCFSNDNAITGVTVSVKVTAVQVKNTFEIKDVQKMNIKSHQEMYLKN
jgi:hypothetical protein